MRKNRIGGIRTIILCAAAIISAVALLAVSISVQARSVDLQQRHQFKIPSERLTAALIAFSTETHMKVVTSAVPSAVFSPGVNGDVSTLNALSALLRGTGMAFRQIDGESIVVGPAQVGQERLTQFKLLGDITGTDALAAAPTAAGAPAAAAPSELQEVQVTGTRIVREGYEAPTPVTAVGLQQLQDVQATNIGDTLNQLPVFQGSTTNATGTTGPEGGQTELNLRDLNAQRTLILFDGRRLPSENTEQVPDIAIIPDALIQRVDVVTGGASAVYGSDAVAGVVNFVLDTNFTGIKGELQGGESGYGDGRSDKVSLTLGTTFADGRVHLLLSGDQRYQAEILGEARGWNIDGQYDIQNPTFATNKSAPEYLTEPCCVGTTYPAGGLILSGPLQGTTFGTGGTVDQYNYGYGLTAAGDAQFGGSWQQSNMHGGSSILTSDAATHYFARVSFDITPDIQVYAQYLSGHDHVNSRCCFDYYQTGIGTLYTSNPYIPQSVLTAAASAGVMSFSLGTSLRFGDSSNAEFGGIGEDHFRSTDIYVIGLKGQLKLGRNSYNWNLYGQMGVEEGDHYDGPESIKVNLANAIQAVKVGSYGANSSYTDLNGKTLVGYNAANYPNPLGIATGTITCLSNLLPLNNPNETSNCVPFNVLGSVSCSDPTGQCSAASQAAFNYTQESAYWHEEAAQNILGGDITGEPFSDWAGPVSVAVDAEYRHESLNGFSDPISQETGYFSTNYFPVIGRQYVTEGALETVIPLLKGLPFVQELDANAGARATDYSTSGYVTTYKYGVEYTPINDLRFRATESFDIRAPNLDNLYAYSNGHGTNVDPFEGNANIPSYGITEGNPNLKAEKAHQFEIGLVFQPSELPGLNVSADYWHIKIDGAISSLSAAYELTSCYNTRIAGTFTGTSPLCALITRVPCSPCLGTAGEAPGTLYSVTTIPFNLASFLAAGVDYAADYRKQMTELVSSLKGTVDLHLNATNTIHNITNTGIPGPAEILDATGTFPVPRWAVFGTLTYELDPWRFSWTERYNSAVLASDVYITCPSNCPNPIPTGFSTVATEPRAPSYFVATVSMNYKFMENGAREAEAFVTVNNVFNKNPPFVPLIPGQQFIPDSRGPLYDEIGLYVRAGIRFRL